MIRVGIVILALLAAVVALEIRAAPDAPADYTLALPTDIFTLDPQRMSVDYDFQVGYCLFEGLLRWNKNTLEPEPAAAESWTVSEDERTYTFRLREAARWSNGDPVRAEDFVFAWRRALSPESAADYSKVLFAIEGAEAWFNWRAEQLERYAARPDTARTADAAAEALREAVKRFDATVGLRALDDRTLEIRLARRAPYFLHLVCLPVCLPVHPPTLDAATRLDPASGQPRTDPSWTRPGRIVGNGPMLLDSWRFKRDMRLVRNPLYWNPDAVRPDAVRIAVMSNPNTALLAYETGGVDWLPEVLVDSLPELIEQGARGERPDVHRLDRFGTYFWSFNCGPTLPGGAMNPFADARVRRAFTLATSRDDIAEKVRRVGDRPAPTFIPPASIEGYDESRSVRGLPFDPVRAREVLAEAGWKDRDGDGVPENDRGEPFPTVELLCSSGSYHARVGLVMGQMWERALGVRSRVVQRESKVFADELVRGQYMMARGFWFGDYPDPTTFLDVHRTGDGNNDRRFSNPRFDELMRAGDAELDPAARMALLAEAEQLALDEAPMLTLFHPIRASLIRPGAVEGVSKHPRLLQHYWAIGRPGAAAAADDNAAEGER